MKPECKERFASLWKEIVEDPDSADSQWGKLGYEGIFASSRFRAMKMYDLSGDIMDGGGSKRRVKGVPKKLAKKLPEETFNQCDKSRPLVTSFSLRATPGLEIGIFKARRVIGACLNRKRKCNVRTVQFPCIFSRLVTVVVAASLLVGFGTQFSSRVKKMAKGPGSGRKGERRERRDMKRAKKFFLSNLKEGKLLTTRELKAEAERKKWEVSGRELKDIKKNWIALAKFEKPIHRPKQFATGFVFRLGNVQTDLAFVRKDREWVAQNQGFVAFLVAVDTATLKVAAIPMKGRTSDDYLAALKKLITGNFFPVIRRLVSDKDQGIASKVVVDTIKSEFGISISFQKIRHKAYLAERMIREVKRRLFMSFAASGDKPCDWRPRLQKVVESLNSRQVSETSFAPKDVIPSNFYTFLDQRLKTNSSFFANTSKIDSEALNSAKLSKSIWKFKKGDRVLVNAKLMPGEMRKLGRTFYKPSRFGGYFDQPFIVTRLRLRRILERDSLVPGITIVYFPHCLYLS